MGWANFTDLMLPLTKKRDGYAPSYMTELRSTYFLTQNCDYDFTTTPDSKE